MGKKIVVITGSPRKNGNSLAMTNAFIEAAEARGHSVTRFDAVSLNVGGCHACETCFRSGKACSFDDDFNSIAPAILEADTIVYTMPVYWYSIPAKIKAVIDKTFPFGIEDKNIAEKSIIEKIIYRLKNSPNKRVCNTNPKYKRLSGALAGAAYPGRVFKDNQRMSAE